MKDKVAFYKANANEVIHFRIGMLFWIGFLFHMNTEHWFISKPITT